MAAETFDTSWMWHPSFREDSKLTAGLFVHFKKTIFVSENPPESLKIHITADTRYKLYINHGLVAFGPVKGDASLWFYDEIDIGMYLRTGENHIGIHVLRLFHGTSYGTSFPRMGSGAVKIGTVIHDTIWTPQIQSSTLWKAVVDPFTILPIDQAEDDFLHVYERGLNLDKSLNWVSAELLQYQSSTGVTAPWKLSPRMIPVMSIEKSKFSLVHNVESCVSEDLWLAAVTGRGCNVRLPASTNHQLDVEIPHHTTAFLRFRFKRPQVAGGNLTVTYSESYEDPPELIPYLRRKGDRRDTRKSLIGPQDSYNFRGQDRNLELGYYENENAEEIFVPFHWRTFRFVRLNIQVGSSDLTFCGIDVDVVRYPLEILSNFKAGLNNGFAELLYQTSLRTLRNCMHDCYEDCPFYEQLQYAMDTRSSVLFTYYTSADDRLAKQAIVQLHNSFQPHLGLTASRAPSNQPQIIPQFSLYWVCMLCDHFDFYGDVDFIRHFLPVMDSVLGYFHSRINREFGLVSLPHSGGIWNFHDWTEQWRPYGIPPSVLKSGISTYTNSLYVYSLRMASKLQLACGNRPALAEEYTRKASQIVDAIKDYCFDGQYFTDSVASDSNPSQDYSQQCQVWAVLSGAVSGIDAQQLLRGALSSSKDRYSFIRTSISMSFYTLRAISLAGGSLYDELFHGFWKPWRDQLAFGLTTWEEDDVSHRSDCHAWGSAPIYELFAEVAGVQPAKPGWEELYFSPRVHLFPSLEVTIPFCWQGRTALAKVGWSETNCGGKTLVSLSIMGLPEPILVHVKLPGHTSTLRVSSSEVSFFVKTVRTLS